MSVHSGYSFVGFCAQGGDGSGEMISGGEFGASIKRPGQGLSSAAPMVRIHGVGFLLFAVRASIKFVAAEMTAPPFGSDAKS